MEMSKRDELEESLVDALNTNTRISNRFFGIASKMQQSNLDVGELQNMVYGLLVSLGYDLKAQDFLEAHNKTFTDYRNNLDEFIENIDDLRKNMQDLKEIYSDLNHLLLEQFGFWEIEE